MKNILLLAAPLALVAGCSSGSADGDGDGEISQEEAEAAVEAANISITPGDWEATIQLTEFDMPQMPEEARVVMREQMGRAQTSNSCITREEAENPQANMFGNNDESNCTYSEFDMSGGNMLIAATCSPEGMGGEMSMRMEGSYTPTSYEMTMTMDVDSSPAGPMHMAGRVNGRHVGESCLAEGGE
jgi:hypothetical protein